MTYREKIAIEHPDFLDPDIGGGVFGCPDAVYHASIPSYCYDITKPLDERCTKCWDREIPEERG